MVVSSLSSVVKILVNPSYFAQHVSNYAVTLFIWSEEKSDRLTVSPTSHCNTLL